jgi:predicted GNAT family acetyltransferase
MTSSGAMGKGVGRLMVEHSLQQAREKGGSLISNWDQFACVWRGELE